MLDIQMEGERREKRGTLGRAAPPQHATTIVTEPGPTEKKELNLLLVTNDERATDESKKFSIAGGICEFSIGSNYARGS